MKPTALVSVVALARRAKMDPRRLRYQLLALAKRGDGSWLLRTKRWLWVNEAALQAQHPAFFEPISVAARLTDLEERAEIADQQGEDQARALGALVGRVEKLEKEKDHVRPRTTKPPPHKGKSPRRRPESNPAPADG